MKKKIGIIVCCYYFTLMLVGLSSCENNCGSTRSKFRVTSLEWGNVKATASGELVEIQDNTVAYNEYAILIEPVTETYISYEPGLNTPLFACSPADPTTDDAITDIQITANKDFDDDYLAGENLAELFDVIVYDYNNIINERFDLIDFLNTNPFAPRQITLVLKQQPETDNEFQFTVKYYQDGEVLDYAEFTTSSIMITH